MKNIDLPHPKIPNQYNPQRNDLRNDRNHARELYKDPHQKLRPHEPTRSNKKNHHKFQRSPVPALKHPHNTKTVIPKEADYV